MTTKPSSLPEIRAGIDRIDDEMLRLIGERLQLAKSLRALKSSSRAAWAPTREHALLQRLLNHKPKNLPAETLVSMWSALITASLMSQGPFVLLCASIEMRALAEAAFPGAPMVELDLENWRQQTMETPGAIALLPAPSTANRWWQDLAKPDPRLYVQTCLPKWPPQKAKGYCVSADPPEWQAGQTGWTLTRAEDTPPQDAKKVVASKNWVLWQSPRPIDQSKDGSGDLPGASHGPMAVGCFFPTLILGIFDV
jgi:chorismate mutase